MVTASRVRLLYPRAEKYIDVREKVDRGWDGNLAGKRVCFVDNGRANADRVLPLVERELVARFQIKPSWIRKKDHVTPGHGAPAALSVNALAPNLEEDADAVVTGIGN